MTLTSSSLPRLLYWAPRWSNLFCFILWLWKIKLHGGFNREMKFSRTWRIFFYGESSLDVCLRAFALSTKNSFKFLLTTHVHQIGCITWQKITQPIQSVAIASVWFNRESLIKFPINIPLESQFDYDEHETRMLHSNQLKLINISFVSFSFVYFYPAQFTFIRFTSWQITQSSSPKYRQSISKCHSTCLKRDRK